MKCLFSFFHPHLTYGLLWSTKKNAPPSCFSKSVWRNIFCGRQKTIFWRILVDKHFWWPLTFLNKSSFVRREGRENNMRVRKLWQNFQFWMITFLLYSGQFSPGRGTYKCMGEKVYKNTQCNFFMIIVVTLLWLSIFLREGHIKV